MVVADLDTDKAAEVVAKIEARGGEAIAARVEVTDRRSVEACVARAIRELGTVDILVNCAGWVRTSLPEEVSEEVAEKQISINLTGTWFFC